MVQTPEKGSAVQHYDYRGLILIVSRVLSQLNAQFTPFIGMIKKCMDSLTEEVSFSSRTFFFINFIAAKCASVGLDKFIGTFWDAVCFS